MEMIEESHIESVEYFRLFVNFWRNPQAINKTKLSHILIMF